MKRAKIIIASVFILCFSSLAVQANSMLVIKKRFVNFPRVQSFTTTPRGTQVPTIRTLEDFTEQEKQTINTFWKMRYPRARILQNSAAKFNCHSYAWISQMGNNIHWLNAPNQYKFWKDGSYARISGWPYRNMARIRYVSGPYGPIDHSAIVSNATYGLVASKWGFGPVMQHRLTDCPYAGGSISYQQYIKAQ